MADRAEEEVLRLTGECLRLRDAILDIDAHATPYGTDETGEFVAGGYLVSVGSLHRALGVVGHSAVKCRECEPGSHDCGTADRLWNAMARACNHPERWNEILSEALDATADDLVRPCPDSDTGYSLPPVVRAEPQSQWWNAYSPPDD